MDMKNLLFMTISSFLPLAFFNLFAEGNSSMAQPQMGQPQQGAALSQGLEAYSLPAGIITENDMPRIKAVIEQVLNKISESMKSAGKRTDYQGIKSGILNFQDWLKRQGCVGQASTTYNLEATDKYSENIFMTYPGQLPFDIVFKMGGDIKKQHRLLIFVSTVDFLKLASLVENKSIGGVAVLKNWPSAYLDVRPRI
jgi:hypothetical protein